MSVPVAVIAQPVMAMKCAARKYRALRRFSSSAEQRVIRVSTIGNSRALANATANAAATSVPPAA